MSSLLEAAQPGSFKNRTVIITGGAGCIGRPLSLAFAHAGADVIVNDYGCSVNGDGSSTSPAQQLVDEIVSRGFSAVVDFHNVATDADKIVAKAIDQFGRLDVIVNNAGIITYGSIDTQTPAEIKKVFEVNALGAIALCHYAWPYFKKQKFGRIVNFTSDSVFGMPSSTAYVLSRGALLGVTRTLALEGRPDNILVNTIGPSAYSRMVADVIKDLPEEQQVDIKALFPGEANVPAILALASQKLTYSGQIWNTGSYTLGRTILGTVKDVKGLKTVDECLLAMGELLDKDRDWAEPHSVSEFLAFKAQV